MAIRHEGNREEYEVEEDVRSKSLPLQELPSHRQEQHAATKQKRPPCPLLGRVGRR